MLARTLSAAALAVVLVFALAGPAEASTASVGGTTLTYLAAPSEDNNTVITLEGGAFTVEELVTTSPVSITAGPGCSGGPNKVSCAEVGITSVQVALGDLADSFTYRAVPPIVVDGGPANDVYEAYEGAGAAFFVGGEGNDFFRGLSDAVDVAVLGSGRDSVTVGGFGGADIYRGGPGPDSMFAKGGGSQRFLGQGGADTFRFLKDGSRDVVRGGPGRDCVLGRVDARDKIQGVELVSARC